MLELSERMQWMLENQGKWALEYKEQQARYKLAKNRAEKARVKERKKLEQETQSHAS